MKLLIYSFYFITYLLYSASCRSVQSSDLEPQINPELKSKQKLHAACMLRSLENGEAVVIKWGGQLKKVSWENTDVDVADYIPTRSSHTYPASSGLSGYGGIAETTTSDPFAESPVFSDDYDLNDIKEWFKSDCLKHV